jgi:hypothetical protein
MRDRTLKMLDFLGLVPMRKRLKNGPADSCVPGTGKCNTRGGEVKYLFVNGVEEEVLCGERGRPPGEAESLIPFYNQ